VTFTLTLISQQDHNYSFVDKMWERKLNLAYINPLTSLRWRCSFLLKPDNEFSAIIFSLNIFHLLITLLLKKNLAISNVLYVALRTLFRRNSCKTAVANALKSASAGIMAGMSPQPGGR